MLRILSKPQTMHFRSLKPEKIDFNQIQKIREYNSEHLSGIYIQPDRKHEDIVYEENIYGKSCYIVGLTPNSNDSATFVKSVFVQLKPSHVILGGFNNYSLISEGLANSSESKRTMRTYDFHVEPHKMFCKTLITPMITKLIQQNPDYEVEEASEVVYHYDHKNRAIKASTYLTILNRIMQKQFCKLSFGAPSDLLIFQEIMINEEIEALRQVFDRVIGKVRQNKNQLGKPEPSLIFYPDLVLDQIRYEAHNEQLLFNKQLTYTTSLLKRYTAVAQKVVLFVPTNFVSRIADNVHKMSLDPKLVYRGGNSNNPKAYQNDGASQMGMKIHSYLNADNKANAVEEILEKFAILCFLKSDALEKQLVNDRQNIFQKTIFSDLFGSMSVSEIAERYLKIKDVYKLKFSQILAGRVKNALNYKVPQKDFYTLTEMIHTQQQRNQDFPVSMQVENRNTIQQKNKDHEDILEEIHRIRLTELFPDEKQKLEEHLAGSVTKDSLLIYNKAFVQAKINLKKTNVKLPIHHYASLSSLFKKQLKQKMYNPIANKMQKSQFIRKIENMKDRGQIQHIVDEQEIQRITSQNQPILSMSVGEDGQVSFESGCQNQVSAKELISQMQKDPVLREMVGLSEEGKQEIDEEYEEKERPTRQNVTEQISLKDYLRNESKVKTKPKLTSKNIRRNPK